MLQGDGSKGCVLDEVSSGVAFLAQAFQQS